MILDACEGVPALEEYASRPAKTRVELILPVVDIPTSDPPGGQAVDPAKRSAGDRERFNPGCAGHPLE